MIEINENSNAMHRATAKARIAKPFVRVTAWRRYEVTNKKSGATYHVEFDVRNGKRLASCDCKAGQRETLCYHVASSAGIHACVAMARRA